jgi:prepilin-type N-terminal cleavage/methylation domain-containing protein
MLQMHRKKRNRSRSRGGFSLVEIVVAVAIIAMISAGITVAVIRIATEQKVRLTRSNAETLRSSIKVWWALSDSTTCPTIPMLLADGAVDRGKSVKEDGWGQPWRITCDDRDATIVSMGPDELPDTEDDIRVPPS